MKEKKGNEIKEGQCKKRRAMKEKKGNERKEGQ